MTKNKREIYAESKPQIREVEGDKPSRLIEGYAVVFGVESKVIVDWYDAFREIISAEAITQELLDSSDIKMTLWHNREKLLARANMGEGTLHLTVDEKGVKYSFEAPNTPDGQTAVELVQRGDLAGASFTFWTREENCSYAKAADDVIIRTVNKIDGVSEMTIASDPAYPQTTAEMPNAVRELLNEKPEGEEEQEREEPKFVKGPLVAKARLLNNY